MKAKFTSWGAEVAVNDMVTIHFRKNFESTEEFKKTVEAWLRQNLVGCYPLDWGPGSYDSTGWPESSGVDTQKEVVDE